MGFKRSGRATHGEFVGIPRAVLNSRAFIDLPAQARALYLDLRRQHNGKHNGDITIADSVLSKYGWAHSSIHEFLKEIIEYGLMVKTRDGGIATLSRIPSRQCGQK